MSDTDNGGEEAAAVDDIVVELTLDLVGEEVDGWKILGLEPPTRSTRLELEAEQQAAAEELLLPSTLEAGDAASKDLSDVLSVIVLHLEESDRRWEQQREHNATLQRKLEQTQAAAAAKADEGREALASLSARVLNIENRCQKMADDSQAMGASVRAESARIEQQVAQVSKTMGALDSVPKKLESLRATVGRLGLGLHAVEAQAESALHTSIADGAAAAVLERAEAENVVGGLAPPSLSVLRSRAALCATHTARPFGGDGPVSVRGAFLAWRAVLPRLGSDDDWRSSAAPLEDAAAAASLGRLQERVAERVEARWRLFDSMDLLRTSVDGVRDAGAVEQTRADRAEDTLRQAIDGGLSDAAKRSDAMKAELSAQMVNLEHLEALQKKMNKATADAGGANDSAKSAVSDAREAMRLIYELSKKVDESDPDVIKEKLAAMDLAVQARAEKSFVEEAVSSKVKTLAGEIAGEMKGKAGKDETTRAMQMVTGLGERVDGLSGLNSKMDRVEANTDLLTNQYDNRLLSLEGAVMDKAAKDLVDQLQARGAKLEAQVRELQDDSDEEEPYEPPPPPPPAPAPAPAPPPVVVTKTVSVAAPAPAPGLGAAATAKATAEATALRQAQERAEREAQEDRDRQKKERDKEKAERKKLVTKKELEKKLSKLAGRISVIDSALQAAEKNPPTLAALMPGSSAFRCLACDAPLIERGGAGDFQGEGASATVQIPGAVSQLYGATERQTVASFMDGSDAMDRPTAAPNASGYVPPVWSN